MYCIFGGPQHHVHLIRRPAPRSFSLSQENLRLSGLRPRRRCGLITGVGSRQRRVLPCDEGAPSSSPPAKSLLPASERIRLRLRRRTRYSSSPCIDDLFLAS
ncbi:hypothetical protein PVAP13_7KG304103 [Panicum virgatum]|uniref:Uncharacterized protein n=1 Tax=Panicum virgatum TaxID=38727 RepID=A0A8T0QPA1_PANVG|nr:hypothetical protein PVAP13_7KG304103 [Panicum virgatum]